MALDYLHVNDLDTATLDDTDQIIVGEGNTFKKTTLANLKGSILGSEAEYTEDTVPYLSARQTKSAGIVGKVAMEQIVGGSLGWNQLLQELGPSWSNESGVTATYSNGVATIASTVAINGIKCVTPSTIVGHKYLMSIMAMSASPYDIRFGYVSASGIQMGGQTSSSWQTFASVKACVEARAQIYIYGTTPYSGLQVKNAMILDLTAMFGSTIADYIYNLETATASSGIAKLKSWGIDLDTYHAYDAGSIQSVEATAHITKDANENIIGNYPLGSDTLRGYPMLVNNELAFDGDEKLSDGTINRRYYQIDPSAWTQYASSNGFKAYRITGTPVGSALAQTGARAISNAVNKFGGFSPASMTERIIQISGGTNHDILYLALEDGVDPTTVELVYELATPTTESGTAYQRTQTVDADGTEEFVSNTVVPVGHKTLIPENVLGALSVLVG